MSSNENNNSNSNLVEGKSCREKLSTVLIALSLKLSCELAELLRRQKTSANWSRKFIEHLLRTLGFDYKLL